MQRKLGETEKKTRRKWLKNFSFIWFLRNKRIEVWINWLSGKLKCYHTRENRMGCILKTLAVILLYSSSAPCMPQLTDRLEREFLRQEADVETCWEKFSCRPCLFCDKTSTFPCVSTISPQVRTQFGGAQGLPIGKLNGYQVFCWSLNLLEDKLPHSLSNFREKKLIKLS